MSKITTVGSSFFSSFNQNGRIIHLPSSFKRPVLNSTQASQTNNFLNAFNSPSYRINRHATKIINGGATPSSNRATFSSNQPGVCDIDANRKADPGMVCIPPTIFTGSTDIKITVVTTGANQTVTVNKYFARNQTINRGDGTPTTSLTADTTKTYATSGTYTITLSLTGANRWLFAYTSERPLIPKS